MTVRDKIDLLKNSLDLDLFEDALGIEVIKEMGDEDICRCPLPSHNGVDSNPSFSINRAKLVYNCFACGIGGNIIDLVARIMDVDYDAAYKFCRSYDDSTLGKDDPYAFGKKLESIFATEKGEDKEYNPLPRFNAGSITAWVNNPTDYFAKRGISDDTRIKFMLGYDPNHIRGTYSGPAAIIPNFFQGSLVGYQERWLEDNRPKHIPKYTNTNSFPKKETLFGYDIAIGNNDKPVVVVESALTSVYLDQIGYPSVATFGSQVTSEQIRLLTSFSWGVVLSFDNDSAGKNACDHVSDRLRKTVPVHIVDSFGDEKADLNDLPEQDVVQLIENAKPWFMKEI